MKVKKVYLLIILIFFGMILHSEDYKADKFLKNIKNSQIDYFNQIVSYYDSLLKKNHNPDIMIEKCRFIENALYDEVNEENPKYDQWQNECNILYKLYPDNIDVLIYKLEHTYEDKDIIDLSNKIINISKNLKTNKKIAIVYEKLANEYSNNDKTKEAIDAALNAIKIDKESQVYITLARLYIKDNKKDLAYSIIKNNFNILTPFYKKQACEILLENNYSKDALFFYEKIIDDKTIYFNYEKIAKAYELNGNFEKSRIYLLKNLDNSYDKDNSLRNLFIFDLNHSSKKLVYSSYRSYRDKGFINDPLSIYRMQLFFKHPLTGFVFTDWLGFFLIILIIIICLIIPYLWILPIHYFGNYINRNKTLKKSMFSLKYLWLISSIILISLFLSTAIFNYDSLINQIQDKFDSVTNDKFSETIYFIFYSLFLAISVIIIMFKTKTYSLLKPVKPDKNIIIIIIVSIILYLIISRINGLLFPEAIKDRMKEITGLTTNITTIKSMISILGLFGSLFFVTILVPFYEEFIFRGIILQSIKRYFPFWICNIIQSSIFSLMHFEIKMFFVYFTLGFIFGLLYKKTKTIFASIIFHSVNNTIFTLLLFALMK